MDKFKELIGFSLLLILTGCSLPTQNFDNIQNGENIDNYSTIKAEILYKPDYRFDLISINGKFVKEDALVGVFKPGETTLELVCSYIRNTGKGGYEYVPIGEISVEFNAKKGGDYTIARTTKSAGHQTRNTGGVSCRTDAFTGEKTCKKMKRVVALNNVCSTRLEESISGEWSVQITSPKTSKIKPVDNPRRLHEYKKYHSKNSKN